MIALKRYMLDGRKMRTDDATYRFGHPPHQKPPHPSENPQQSQRLIFLFFPYGGAALEFYPDNLAENPHPCQKKPSKSFLLNAS